MMQLGARSLVRRFSRLAAAGAPAETTSAGVPRMPAFDHVPLPYDGPSAADIARKRAEYLSPSLFHFYSKPVRRSVDGSNARRIHIDRCICEQVSRSLRAEVTVCIVACVLQLNIVEGKRQYLYDEHGRRYLDAFAGIATVCCGHCHPDVVDAITRQAKRLQHSTVLYLNHVIADFAEALASKLPGDLKARCWLIASCTDSVRLFMTLT